MRTWGLKGQTPVVKKPVGSGKGLAPFPLFLIQVGAEFIRGRKNPIYVIMDGHPVHKSKKVREFVNGLKGRLSLFLLPPYAPDLNPDELVWNYLRHTGTAREPLKKSESLWERTFIDLEHIRQNKALIRSFFKQPSVSFAAA